MIDWFAPTISCRTTYLVDIQNLSCSFLHFPHLMKEIPEARLCYDFIRSEDLDTVHFGVGILLSRQLPSHHLVLTKSWLLWKGGSIKSGQGEGKWGNTTETSPSPTKFWLQSKETYHHDLLARLFLADLTQQTLPWYNNLYNICKGKKRHKRSSSPIDWWMWEMLYMLPRSFSLLLLLLPTITKGWREECIDGETRPTSLCVDKKMKLWWPHNICVPSPPQFYFHLSCFRLCVLDSMAHLPPCDQLIEDVGR